MTRERVRFAVAAIACAVVALGIAARDLGCPGLYYDEVVQAEPALWFLRGELAPPEIPGANHVRLFGGPFPLMTQPYMGALKSQLFIPVFALARADARSLRATTLALAVAGLVFAMAFAWRAYDLPTAAALGALLAVDPSLLFIGRHDWGSFSLGFLLRAVAMLCLLTGWRRRSAVRLAVGGFAAGLAIYNKIDACVAVAATSAALLLAAPGWLLELRRRGSAPAAAAAGLLLGAAPVLAGVGPALAAALAATRAGRRLDEASPGELAEKWTALRATLDGSYFDRLMRAGGSFERLAEQVGAAATPFLWVFVLACAALALWIWLDLRRGRPARGLRFALAAALLSIAGVLLTPRAVRIHHFLNAWPFPQLVVAVAALEAWRRFAHSRIARAGIALVLAAVGLGALRADFTTLDTLRTSCGKGRWSDAITQLAPELDEQGLQAVCLDWGFGGPLRFGDRRLPVYEPVWNLRSSARATLSGGAAQIYLFFQPDYAVYPYGKALLDAVAALPAGSAHVEPHADRDGDTAFVTLHFDRPHRLVYRRGRFEVQLE